MLTAVQKSNQPNAPPLPITSFLRRSGVSAALAPERYARASAHAHVVALLAGVQYFQRRLERAGACAAEAGADDLEAAGGGRGAVRGFRCWLGLRHICGLRAARASALCCYCAHARAPTDSCSDGPRLRVSAACHAPFFPPGGRPERRRSVSLRQIHARNHAARPKAALPRTRRPGPGSSGRALLRCSLGSSTAHHLTPLLQAASPCSCPWRPRRPRRRLCRSRATATR